MKNLILGIGGASVCAIMCLYDKTMPLGHRALAALVAFCLSPIWIPWMVFLRFCSK